MARLDAPRRLVATALVAGVASGLPSTLVAALRGDDLLAATRAAGTLVPGRRERPGVVAGAAVHAVLTLWWTTVLTAGLRRARGGALLGAAGGAAIAALDLGVVGRRYPAIRALPHAPQWADHVAFGVVVGVCTRTQPRFPGRLGACRCTTSP
jgi:hypothetical protein